MIDYNWERIYHNVGVVYEDKIVRIANDRALHRFFRSHGRSGAKLLSQHIRSQFEARSGEALQITEKSLAAEIYYHYLMLVWSLKAERAFGRKRFTQWMIRHMNVIDCGNRIDDNNRFLWDMLSIFW